MQLVAVKFDPGSFVYSQLMHYEDNGSLQSSTRC